jgi:DNA polymerase-3 subunit delta
VPTGSKAKKTADILNYAKVKSQIRAGEIHSVYLLCGDEAFLIDKLVHSLQEFVLEPASADLDRVKYDIDGNSNRLDLNKLKAEIQTPPFMSKRKLIIVKNSGLFTAGNGRRSSVEKKQDESDDSDNGGFDLNSNTGSHKDRQNALLELIAQVSDQTCLVFVEAKFDKRLKSMLKVVQENGIVAEMPYENPKILKQWVEAECKQRGLTITSGAADSLVDRCELSMRVIWSELEKLFLYTEYVKTNGIDEETIDLISLPDLRGNIFDLTDAISKGDTGRALVLLDTLIRQRQPLQLIQFMFARHFRQLICAAESRDSNLLIKKLKVPPFVAGRLLQQARQFSLPVMERIYELSFESDMMVKTGRMNDRLVVETLIVRAGEAAKIQSRR